MKTLLLRWYRFKAKCKVRIIGIDNTTVRIKYLFAYSTDTKMRTAYGTFAYNDGCTLEQILRSQRRDSILDMVKVARYKRLLRQAKRL